MSLKQFRLTKEYQQLVEILFEEATNIEHKRISKAQRYEDIAVQYLAHQKASNIIRGVLRKLSKAEIEEQSKESYK